MPLVTPLDALLAEVPLGTPLDPLPEPPQRPGVLDTLAAAERQFNPVTNWWEAAQNKPSTILERRGVKSTVESQPDQSPVPGYDWKTDIAGFEDYAIRFVRSESPAETQAIKDHIRTEASDKQTLRAAGGWGIASSFAVGLTDPVILASMLIPVAPALTGATRLGRVAAGIGAQMAVDTSEELYLHSQQELRTIGDSVFNIGAGALGTGLLGAIALRVPRAEFKAAVDAENALNETVDALRGRRLGAANELMPTKPFKETIAAQGDSWLSRQVDTATTRHPALNGGAKPLGKEVGGVVYAVEPPSSPGALNIAAYAETKPGYWTTVGRLVTDGVRTGADAPLGLRNLAVSESHRSKGVARMMLDTLREEATKANRKLDLSQVLGAELTPDGAKFLNKYFADVVSSPVNPNAPGSDSFGAAKAAVAETTLEDEGIASGGKAIAHTMGQVSPMTRVILSPAKTARQLVQKLVDIPYRLQKNLKGIANPQSVEGLTKRFVATRRWQGTKLLDAAVAEYKQAGGTLSRKEFSREVSLAMTRGDVHEIPQVATLAKWARTTFEDDKAILKEFGVDLADHPLGAKSYFPRVYDFDAIIKNRYTFEQMLYKWFKANPKIPKEGAVDAERIFTEALPGESRAVTNQRLAEADALGITKDLESQLEAFKAARWDAKEATQTAGKVARDVSTEQRHVNRLSSRLRVTLRKLAELGKDAPKVDPADLAKPIEDAKAAAKNKYTAVRKAASTRKALAEKVKNARLRASRLEQQLKSIEARRDRLLAEGPIEPTPQAHRAGERAEAFRPRVEAAKVKLTEARDAVTRAKGVEDAARLEADAADEALFSLRTDLRAAKEGATALDMLSARRARLQAKLDSQLTSVAEKRVAAKQLEEVAKDAVKSVKKQLKEMEALRTRTTEANRLSRSAVPRELDEAELRDEVMKTVEHILGMPSTAADVNVRSLPGPLKSRVLDVPDELLSPYLVHDFETVMSGYARGMAPEIMFRKQGFSSPSMIKELEQVGEEFRVLKAQAGKDVAKIQKLDKAHTAAINDLKLLRDRLNNNVGLRGGQNRQWVRAARIMRLYNYTRLLGSQTLSSLSDYGQLIRRYGLPRTLASTAKFLTNWNANKLARADAHRLGTALEMVLDSRTQQIADILDELPRSRLEQGLQKIGNTFSRVSLMSPWNATIKSLATVLEQDALVRAVKNWDSLSAFQKSALVSNGIDEAAIKRIGPMLEKYGEDTSGLFRARTELWTDQAAAQLVENSIFKVADELVVTRGLGDLPAAMDGELVKTLLQFKSFAMSSVNRTMIPMAQGLAAGDLKTVQGMLSAMTLGMLTYYVKEHAAGRTPDLSAGRLSAEALNWSGSVGYFPEVWDPIASVVGLPRFSRFKSRSPTESWLGPTFGTSVDMLFGTVAGFADGEVTQKDIERLRRAVPYQNLFYIRRLFNAMEGEAGEAVNAKGSNVKTFGQRVTEEVPSR